MIGHKNSTPIVILKIKYEYSSAEKTLAKVHLVSMNLDTDTFILSRCLYFFQVSYLIILFMKK